MPELASASATTNSLFPQRQQILLEEIEDALKKRGFYRILYGLLLSLSRLHYRWERFLSEKIRQHI